MTNKG